LSGYNPYAMADFFNKLSAGDDPRNAASIEFLRTHPTSVNRAASARKQARKLTVKNIDDSLVFELSKARIRYLFSNTLEKANFYFKSNTAGIDITQDNLSYKQIGNLYGLALTSIDLGQFNQAENILRPLLYTYEEYNHFHIAYAHLLTQQGQHKDAINYLKKIMALSPRNIPITLDYSLNELNYGDTQTAHKTLLDLFNNVVPSPSQIKLIAKAANAAEDYADSFSYMAEYYLSIGGFKEAIEQLQLALSIDSINDIQKSKFIARLQEIEDFIAENED